MNCKNCGDYFKSKSNRKVYCDKCSFERQSAIPVRVCELCGKKFRRSVPTKKCKACELLERDSEQVIDYCSEIFTLRFVLKDRHMIINANGSGKIAISMKNVPEFVGEIWDCYDTWGLVRT